MFFYLLILLLLRQIFGGLFVNIANMPTWLQWIQYLSIVRYSLNVRNLSIYLMSNLVFYVCFLRDSGKYCQTLCYFHFLVD